MAPARSTIAYLSKSPALRRGGEGAAEVYVTARAPEGETAIKRAVECGIHARPKAGVGLSSNCSIPSLEWEP